MLSTPEPVFHCKITCDVCGATETITGFADQVDRLAEAHGWVRFAPTGSDLCRKCKGASPNTIIQVRKP